MDTNETSIYTAVIIISVAVGTIIVFFIISMIQQHRKNIELYKAKVKAEVTTLENERARVAADLHDELGPLLFTVKFKISSIDTNPEDQQMLEQAESYIDDILKRIREISNDLMPGTLLRKGILFAIDEFVDTVSKATTIEIKFSHDEIPELSNENSINLYRIVQEIIHNTLKHAKASFLHIQLRVAGNKMILMTQDNGIGFNYSTIIDQGRGLGLRNLQSRAEIMKADMYVESSSSSGTKYTIEIPLPKHTAI